MFKAKRIDTEEVQIVLSVFYDYDFHQTYFLVWDNNGWRWRPAHKYVPPGVDVKDVVPINVKTSLREVTDIIDDDPPF